MHVHHIPIILCPMPPLLCEDANLCTIDTPVCDEATGIWECTRTSKQCLQPNRSCDPTDGLCKPDDQLVPCVAVIDEDTEFGGDEEETWAEFRCQYPGRPFCLLVVAPGPNTSGEVSIPDNFLSDGNVIYEFNIPRDYGDASKASDWVAKCGLDGYTSANVQ